MSIADTFGDGPFKFAAIADTADGDTTLVAAVAGKKIRVVGFVVTAQTTAGLVSFKDSAATLASFSLPSVGGISYSGGPDAPAFETIAGSALTITNGSGVDSYGFITYVLQ